MNLKLENFGIPNFNRKGVDFVVGDGSHSLMCWISAGALKETLGIDDSRDGVLLGHEEKLLSVVQRKLMSADVDNLGIIAITRDDFKP